MEPSKAPEPFLKPFNAAESEPRILDMWEKSGYANPDNLPHATEGPYSIVLPPPNVTGTLHMGHAAMLAIEDILIRYKRMRGYKTLWLPGTDSAAIATQSKVETDIYKKEKKTRHDIGREELLKRIDAFTDESKTTIINQLKKMGSSLDWSRYAYTMDDARYKAVMEAFVRMYDAGLIYRGDRIVNWDPKLQTTVSDDEIEYVEQKDPFYYFQYGPFVIGTVRPETKFGDKYVVMHPEDARYKEYTHGQTLELEWINGPITATVIKDEAADMETGSGVMTITPAHSGVDFEIAQRHGLDIERVIDERGVLMDIAGEFKGSHIKKARAAIVEKLKAKGLVVKTDEEYVHNVATNSRGGGIIEPQIKRQWFVAVNKEAEFPDGKIRTLKGWMKESVQSGGITIAPERFEKIYYHWIDNLRDWCISRQIWFGHRIPVWYCGAPETKRMGFAGDIVKQVFDGKVSTWRLRDHGFHAGDVVAFEDSSTKKIFGYGTITGVTKTVVGEIDLNDKKHYATYKDHDELIEAFKRHNPTKDVGLNTPVWAYEYTFDDNLKKGSCGAMMVVNKAPAACPSCGSTELTQDPDTLDTWFSSGLWTFSTLGWPNETLDLKTFHPTSVLETGYDILFFWVARMILMSGFLLGEVPFKQVYLHGLVRDGQGRKMSKSLGNIIDPLTMIEKYGADATRLSLIIGASPGNDLKLSEDRVRGYKHFANKVWNIARFVLESEGTPDGALLPADEEKVQEARRVAAEVSDNIDKFRLDLAADAVYHFVWGRFAAEIIEESKSVLKGGDAAAKASAQRMLYEILIISIKLLHPFMPFVTEAIWQELPHKPASTRGGSSTRGGGSDLLMIAKWPI